MGTSCASEEREKNDIENITARTQNLWEAQGFLGQL